MTWKSPLMIWMCTRPSITIELEFFFIFKINWKFGFNLNRPDMIVVLQKNYVWSMTQKSIFRSKRSFDHLVINTTAFRFHVKCDLSRLELMLQISFSSLVTLVTHRCVTYIARIFVELTSSCNENVTNGNHEWHVDGISSLFCLSFIEKTSRAKKG